MDFGVGSVGGVGVFFVAEAEGVEFHGTGAIEAPMVLRDGDGELVFVGAGGLEGFEDATLEVDVGEAVGFVHDEELAGEAVAAGVHGGTGFAGFGAGSGGELGVGLVGVELGVGDGGGGIVGGAAGGGGVMREVGVVLHGFALFLALVCRVWIWGAGWASLI